MTIFSSEVWIAGLSGLIFGSFLNVLVYRLPLDLALTKPGRSFCPSCLAQIAWYDNVPILSWLFLGMKCRRCAAPIPWRYPVVEAMTALAFAGAILKFGPTLEGGKLCLYAFLLIGCIFADLEHRILPDEFTLGGAIAGFTLACLHPLPEPKILAILFHRALPDGALNLAEAALGAALPAFLVWGVGEILGRLRGVEALGFGDVKLLWMMGAFYGLIPTMAAVMLGSLLGSIIGLGYIWMKKLDRHTYELPYGSFIGAAALIQQYWLR